MKKFIFLLILLLITSGTVFYFGWIRLPENTQAVVFSSITGYEEKAIKSGSFNWRWQKLIPKTFKLHVFDNSAHISSVVSEGQLPSGKVYSAILTGNPDFTYRIAFSVNYTIDNTKLPELVKSGSLSSEDLSNWYSSKDKVIESEGKNFITSMKGISASMTDSSELEKKLGDHLLSSLDGIVVSSVTLNSFNIPDTDLYNEAKRQYMNVLKNREDLVLQSETRAAKENAELEKQLELLEKYGELLTKYPILLDYIKTNPDMDLLKLKTENFQE